MPEPDSLYLVLHKCRGEATLEVALRWDFGTPSDPAPWWILQSTGNRTYPYWAQPIEVCLAGGKQALESLKQNYPAPSNIRDFYQVNSPPPVRERAPSTSKFKTVADLL